MKPYLLCLCVGCGATADAEAPAPVDAGPVPVRLSGPSGDCDSEVWEYPDEGIAHVEPCAALAPTVSPPTSGTHYKKWANFQRYDQPVSWGFLLHSMEHGGIVFAHNCPGCAWLSELSTFYDNSAADGGCSAPLRNRLIVAPDPTLKVAFAAVAWRHLLKAKCFDAAAVQAFVDTYYAKTVEDLCYAGVDPTDPASGFAPGCGL